MPVPIFFGELIVNFDPYGTLVFLSIDIFVAIAECIGDSGIYFHTRREKPKVINIFG